MKKEKRHTFSTRAFVAIVGAISGIGLLLSGLANHFLQNASMGFHRHDWMAAHWYLGILFLMGTLWHAMLNRKVLLKYIRGTSLSLNAFGREFILAGTLVGGSFLLAATHAF